MPAPANDLFANASTLFSGSTGSAIGTNVGATAEAGDPAPNNGKTVWWIWKPVKTENITFGVRYRPGLSQQTDFPTVLSIFTGTALANISLIGSATGYAGWEEQGQVSFRATQGQTYYIRVDGFQGKEGKIGLWWEPTAELVPWDCGECQPTSAIGETCMGTFRPDIFSQNSKLFNVPAGTYSVRYCGGAWNYRDGWVVGRTSDLADQIWTGNDVIGRFFTVRYWPAGVLQRTFLPEPRIDHTLGYNTPEEAQAAAFCGATRFKHDGSHPIELYFTDQLYPDNVAWIQGGTPLYGLYRVVPVLLEQTPLCVRTGADTYEVTFKFVNFTDEDFPGVTATLQLGGGVLTTTGPVSNITIPANQQAQATFTFTVPANQLNVFATVKLSDGGFNTYQDLHYDLTPRIMVTTGIKATKQGAPANTWSVTLQVKTEGLPTIDTTAVLSGGIVGSPRSFHLGEISNVVSGNGQNWTFTFQPVDPSSGSVTLNCVFTDTGTGVTFPPAQIGIFL